MRTDYTDNRAARRANEAQHRRRIRKGVPFGRIQILAYEEGPSPRDNRVVYRHPSSNAMMYFSQSHCAIQLFEAGADDDEIMAGDCPDYTNRIVSQDRALWV